MRLLKLLSKVLNRAGIKYRIGLWNTIRRFRKSVTVTTRQGVFTLPLEIDDSISKSLYVSRNYELDLVTSVMEFIRNMKNGPKGKGTVIDIGANNGVISIGMLVTGELDKAIAIEPDPRNFSILKQNVAQNHLEGAIACLNYALSDCKSILQFELSESNYGDHRVRKAKLDTKEIYGESKRQIINVESDTLDNLLADVDIRFRNDIAVIWVDVQGYEGYVFQGAKRVFSNGMPVVSEIWPYGIRRSGMSQEDFCSIVETIWSAYWVKRRGKFIRYPTNIFILTLTN